MIRSNFSFRFGDQWLKFSDDKIVNKRNFIDMNKGKNVNLFCPLSHILKGC